MRRRLKQGAIVFVIVFAVAQLVRPERTNPPTHPSSTIQAHVGTTSGLVSVLDRSCEIVTQTGRCGRGTPTLPLYPG